MRADIARSEKGEQSMRSAYFVAGLILGVAGAVFGLQNSGVVEIQFLTWQMHLPLALVVFGALGAGLVVALLLGVPEALWARWRIRGLERRLQDRPQEPETPRMRDAA
jgi:uncharacterized integral membrane protein